MKTFLSVEIDGREPVEVKVTSRDIAKWERAKSGRHLGIFANTPRMADLQELAFYALVRLGLWDGDLPTLRETADVTEVPDPDDEEQEDDAEGLDPTRPGR